MEINTLFHDRYRLEEFLGCGAYSEVWLANDEKIGDAEVALKIFAPATGLDDADIDMFAHEFSIVIGVNDANILKPLHYDSSERMPYLVLPYCKNGSVKNMVGKMSELDAWEVIHDVATGLKSLHSMTPPIIHQDIKPDNIMISDSGHYLITDFGVSTRLHATIRKSIGDSNRRVGTWAYMAPERFSRHRTAVMASDVYSLGATIYELLSGETPFGEDGGLLQKSGADIPELEGYFSTDIKKILDRCLAQNPWKRPSTEELIVISEKKIRNVYYNKSRKTNKLLPDFGNTLSEEERERSKYYYTVVAIIGVIIGIVLALVV